MNSYAAAGPDSYAEDTPWIIQHAYTMTDASGWFSTYPYWPGGAELNYAGCESVSDCSYSAFIRLVFTPPKNAGAPLSIGTYEGAQRASFATPDRPGLDLTWNSTGFNTIDGRFQVYDVQWGADGKLASLAASFEIESFFRPGKPGISGRIWFNSDVPMTSVPEPGGTTLLLAGLAVSASAFRKRKAVASAA
ncbi:MAG: PEP-CTERM sorting domain-containing protein [Rubrivivax sp.]|nr:MAG: PEP-CTERM sorting domain-containing protein [Rubrivivax sp.]